MNPKQRKTYEVLKPVRWKAVSYAPGDKIKMHPKQAVYLVTNGTLRLFKKSVSEPPSTEGN